ncbi:unnamed protein product, partial [Adineta ricciae]
SRDTAFYNELSPLKVVHGSLSIDRLTQALRYVLAKHKILRTSLRFNTVDGALTQSITNKHETFEIIADRTYENEEELQSIVHQLTVNPNLFDLSSGRVFYCEILRPKKSPTERENNRIIGDKDILVIGFHHAATDRSSRPTFSKDFYNAYNNDLIWPENEDILQYIDYSVHERVIDMTASRNFWRAQLDGYKLEHQLLLPVDRHRLASEQRSNASSFAQICFDDDVSALFFDYSTSHYVTPFQLGLAVFYTFLFKLTHGQTDLCLSAVNANRYRTELQNLIGMFVSTLPYRIQLNANWSFDELIEVMRNTCVSIFEHSHYPLQQILADLQMRQSSATFLETMFEFGTTVAVENRESLNDASFEYLPVEESFYVAKFDFMLWLSHRPSINGNNLFLNIACSRDLFDAETVFGLAQRFNNLLQRILQPNVKENQSNRSLQSFSKFNLLSPDELMEIQNEIFCRQSTITNEGMFIIL